MAAALAARGGARVEAGGERRRQERGGGGFELGVGRRIGQRGGGQGDEASRISVRSIGRLRPVVYM
ncbi:MAG: hypothetical protein H6703_10195 [Myxococcales bacterium]|nr:hypothetical protein [Myxococcales bacterium]